MLKVASHCYPDADVKLFPQGIRSFHVISVTRYFH